MKQWLIRFLLRMLGVNVSSFPELNFFVVVESGERVADVTMNKNRAVAVLKERQAQGNLVALYRAQIVERVVLR